MRLYEIWREGFKSAGDIQRAALLGKFKAENFEMAIHRYNIKAAMGEVSVLIKKKADGEWYWGKSQVFETKYKAQKKYG